MLSILIPTYNYDITKLVNDLHHQAEELGVDYEIIVMEDGSEKFLEENQSVTSLKNCNYIRLSENVGRSAIRNKLADVAKYEFLLFLDCDAAIPNRDFLSKYLSFCDEPGVVLGGRIYNQNDTNPAHSLLSKYGTKKECNDLNNLIQRHKFPVFTSPNFLIAKSLFNKVRFDESIKGYGHEDTIFGIKLQESDLQFNFIDNPVIHVGLETNSIFLKKSEVSVIKLYDLYVSGNYPGLVEISKLLRIFNKLRKYHLVKLFSLKFYIIKPLMIRNLTGKNPSLFMYDLYKLLFLCSYVVKTDKMTAP
jgi:glycosyltransferase involved in cell wall biosynthesis